MAWFAAGIYFTLAVIAFGLSVHMFRENERKGYRDLHIFPAIAAFIGLVMLGGGVILATG